MSLDWPALEAARRQLRPRLRFHVDGEAVGSVAEADAPALAAWPRWIARDAQGLHLAVPREGRDEALAEMNAGLRARGLIVAWRDETFGLLSPSSGAVLATLERAACRFWGTLTLGAHANGYVCADAEHPDRPTHLWIARRSPHKATDPGRLDNLVGGGVPHGQSPFEALCREGWEEAGLTDGCMRRARPGRILRIDCDVPEGRMLEHIHAHDLELPVGQVPANQDGEVAEIRLMAVAEAAARAADGEMTTDAALVTLDFLLRRALLPRTVHDRLAPHLDALCVTACVKA